MSKSSDKVKLPSADQVKAEKSNDEVIASVKEKIDSLVPEAIAMPEEDEELIEMPAVEIDGNKYIGYLSIPAIGMEYPVMGDWDYNKLKIAPCRYYGSLYTRDLVICGHNYKSVFGRLKRLKKGDEIYFTDAKGDRYKFEVDIVEILEATDIEPMINSPWDMSLYTCTYGGKQRVTVRCKMITE